MCVRAYVPVLYTTHNLPWRVLVPPQQGLSDNRQNRLEEIEIKIKYGNKNKITKIRKEKQEIKEGRTETRKLQNKRAITKIL